MVGGAGIVFGLFKMFGSSDSDKVRDLGKEDFVGAYMVSDQWKGRRKIAYRGEDGIGTYIEVEGVPGFFWLNKSSIEPVSLKQFLINPNECTYRLRADVNGGKVVTAGISENSGMDAVFSAVEKERKIQDLRASEENKTIEAQHIQNAFARDVGMILPKAGGQQQGGR